MMIRIPATANALTGAIRAGTTTLSSTPLPLTPPPPTAASMAPITPPIRACDELDGRPYIHVIRFQAMAPSSPAKAIVSVTCPASMIPVAIVAATLSDTNAPTKFRIEASAIAVTRRQRPGRDRRGDDVGGVVKAVGEVEGQGGDDDHHQQELTVHAAEGYDSGRVGGGPCQGPLHQLGVDGTGMSLPPRPLAVGAERPRVGVVV